MAEKNNETVQKYLLFDTNIVQYLTSEKVGLLLFQYLCPIFSSFMPAISQITLCEHLSGLNANDEKSKQYIYNYDYFLVDTPTLVGAARLQNLYKKECKEVRNIDLGDRLIAATSIIHNMPVVTANVQDFPRPFFREIDSYTIEYEHNGKKKYQNIQILHPDLVFINNKLSEHGYT